MCFPGWGKRITCDMCFPGGGTHITRDMCFLGRGTHITRDMCFPGGEHISLGICVSQVGDHILLGIRVSQVGERISLGIRASQVQCEKWIISYCAQWAKCSNCPLTVEQFDPASPRRFEIVDLTVGVRCGSALDAANHGGVWSTLLAI